MRFLLRPRFNWLDAMGIALSVYVWFAVGFWTSIAMTVCCAAAILILELRYAR